MRKVATAISCKFFCVTNPAGPSIVDCWRNRSKRPIQLNRDKIFWGPGASSKVTCAVHLVINENVYRTIERSIRRRSFDVFRLISTVGWHCHWPWCSSLTMDWSEMMTESYTSFLMYTRDSWSQRCNPSHRLDRSVHPRSLPWEERIHSYTQVRLVQCEDVLRGTDPRWVWPACVGQESFVSTTSSPCYPMRRSFSFPERSSWHSPSMRRQSSERRKAEDRRKQQTEKIRTTCFNVSPSLVELSSEELETIAESFLFKDLPRLNKWFFATKQPRLARPSLDKSPSDLFCSFWMDFRVVVEAPTIESRIFDWRARDALVGRGASIAGRLIDGRMMKMNRRQCFRRPVRQKRLGSREQWIHPRRIFLSNKRRVFLRSILSESTFPRKITSTCLVHKCFLSTEGRSKRSNHAWSIDQWNSVFTIFLSFASRVVC